MSTEQIQQEIQTTYTRLKQAAADARYWYEHYLDDIKARYQQRLQEIERAYQAKQDQVQAQLQEALTTAEAASAEVQRQAQTQLAQMRSAFRWVVSPWEDPLWQDYAPQLDAPIPSAVRMGRLAIPEDVNLGDLPALMPLLGKGHVFLTGDNPDTARQILQVILLRLVVSFPPGTLRLTLADPVGLGANLAAFLRLPDTLRGDKVCSRPEEIEKQLDALEKHIETVVQSRLQNLYPTIEAYNEQAGEIAVPYYILALTDFPAGFSDRMAERLLHIARNGPRAGVYIVASLNYAYAFPRNFTLTDLTSLGTTLRLSANRLTWDDPEFGQYPIVPDALPVAERVNQLLEQVGVAVQQVAVSLAFRRIAIPERERWQGDATDGLRVSIGISSTGEVHDLTIGQEGSIIHHGLIGGTVGSGKSNLLHVLITQMALRYPPDELEMYLVDFKEGVEFQDYLTLPHARAVGLESEREFGRSVLRRLQADMEERGRLYKSANVNSLAAYRRQTGAKLPRVLLVMDEFQVLFSEDDLIARESGQILEDLVRRGRAFGIHIVLSSQTPSAAGMYGNRIYGQVGLRIALRSQPKEAQAILGEGNEAASQLEQTGEAIYNDEMGHKEKNIRIRVAWLPPDERRRYLEHVRALAQARPYVPPVTFEGRAAARLEANPELQALLGQRGWRPRPAAAHVWLGEPIEIKPSTAATLERYARSNLLIVGGDDAQAYGLLLSALLSLATQCAPNDVRFAIADFARPESPGFGLFARLSLPHPLEVAGPRQVGALLTQLLALLDQRVQSEAAGAEVYFLVAGLHRWRELRGADAFIQTDAAKQLARLAEEGPEVGMHLIVWADGFATLERVFKRAGVGNFDLRVAFHLPEKDSNDLLGSNAAARLGENRALFRHEDWELGRLEKFKPYAIPEADVLTRLMEQLRAKGAKEG